MAKQDYGAEAGRFARTNRSQKAPRTEPAPFWKQTTTICEPAHICAAWDLLDPVKAAVLDPISSPRRQHGPSSTPSRAHTPRDAGTVSLSEVARLMRRCYTASP